MSAKRHLRELQMRLMLVAAFFIAGACLAYSYQEQLVPLLMAPLHGERLIYLNPAGGFTFILLVSVYAGIAAGFPILLQQIYAFLRPALPGSAQKNSWKIIISSLLLLVAGLLFGYFVAVPNALEFLYSFADKYVDASLTAESYLNFMIAYTIGIGLVFQLPLLLLLVHAIRPLTPGGMMRSQRWVILGAFIVAAVITPTPDPVNQTIVAVPVIFVYQLGVFAVMISIARQKRRVARSARTGAHAAQAIAAAPVRPVVAPQPLTVQAPAQPLQTALESTKPQPAVRSIDGFRRPAPTTLRPQPVVPSPQAPTQPARSATPLLRRPPMVPRRSMDGIRVPQRAMTF